MSALEWAAVFAMTTTAVLCGLWLMGHPWTTITHWLEEEEPMHVCRYCNQEIKLFGETWSHTRGPGSHIRRCLPELSGLPYGVEATPLPGTYDQPQ